MQLEASLISISKTLLSNTQDNSGSFKGWSEMECHKILTNNTVNESQ